MDEKDRLLLAYLEKGLPVTSRPFEDLGRKMGMDSAEVLLRLQRLKKEKVIRGVSGFFDASRFENKNAWVAMAFQAEGLEDGAKIVGEHPGVGYSCSRDHELNFWFWISVPGFCDLEKHIDILAYISKAKKVLYFPTLKSYKNAEVFSEKELPAEPQRHWVSPLSSMSPKGFKPEEIGLVRVLQEEFPLTDAPYKKISSKIALSETQILELIQELMRQGFLKRIGTNPQTPRPDAGNKSLIVWQIPEEKHEVVASEMFRFKELCSCERKPSYPEFPYSLHTVFNISDAKDREVILRRIEDKIGRWPRRYLALVKEYKKTRPKIFPAHLELWWEKNKVILEESFRDPVGFYKEEKA